MNPCVWCRYYEPGYCWLHDVPTREYATCADWLREPGADDDREQ